MSFDYLGFKFKTFFKSLVIPGVPDVWMWSPVCQMFKCSQWEGFVPVTHLTVGLLDQSVFLGHHYLNFSMGSELQCLKGLLKPKESGVTAEHLHDRQFLCDACVAGREALVKNHLSWKHLSLYSISDCSPLCFPYPSSLTIASLSLQWLCG